MRGPRESLNVIVMTVYQNEAQLFSCEMYSYRYMACHVYGSVRKNV